MSIQLEKVTAVRRKEVTVDRLVKELRGTGNFLFAEGKIQSLDDAKSILTVGKPVNILFNNLGETTITQSYKLKIASRDNISTGAMVVRVFPDHDAYINDISSRNFRVSDIRCVVVGDRGIEMCRKALSSANLAVASEDTRTTTNESLVHKLSIIKQSNDKLEPVLKELAKELQRKHELMKLYKQVNEELGSIKDLEQSFHETIGMI